MASVNGRSNGKQTALRPAPTQHPKQPAIPSPGPGSEKPLATLGDRLRRGWRHKDGVEAHTGPWLILRGFTAEFWCHLITERPQRLGRAPDSHIVIPHSSISRVHAEIWRRGSQVFVRDLSSRHGVFVNGRRVTESAVAVGDTIRLASIPLQVIGTLAEEADNTPVPGTKHDYALPVARDQLSDAERRVFDLLLQGLPEKTVAKRLDLSPHTVHIHTHNIYHAFGVHSRPELLARFYAQTGEWDVPSVPSAGPALTPKPHILAE